MSENRRTVRSGQKAFIEEVTSRDDKRTYFVRCADIRLSSEFRTMFDALAYWSEVEQGTARPR